MKRKPYLQPAAEVNDFISRNGIMGWGLGEGSTMEQLSKAVEPVVVVEDDWDDEEEEDFTWARYSVWD